MQHRRPRSIGRPSIWPLLAGDCGKRPIPRLDLHALGGVIGAAPATIALNRLVLAQGTAGENEEDDEI